MAETLLRIGGIYNLLFVVFHLFFWKLFDWKNDLASLTSINRAVMQVLNLCLTYVFIVFGLLSLLYPDQMAGTELGRALTGSIAVFWFLRALEQIVFFKLKNWISWAFLAAFLVGTSLYGAALL